MHGHELGPAGRRQQHRALAGRSAEDLAAEAYERAGSRILARNYRLKCGEIDIVVEEPGGSGTTLVFVEVRARCRRASWETPAESLTFPKLQRLRKAAAHFLAGYRGPAVGVRFDLASWDFSELRIERNFWWY